MTDFLEMLDFIIDHEHELDYDKIFEEAVTRLTPSEQFELQILGILE